MQKRGHRPRFFAILIIEIKFKIKKIRYGVGKKDKTDKVADININ